MYKSLENKIKDMLEGKTGAISVSKDRETMEHDPDDQVTVGTYKSKHFEISPEAQKLFSQGIPKNSNAIDAEQLAIHHDKLFSLVKGAMVKKQVSDTDIENAQDHLSKIQYLATKLGLEGQINYLTPHIEKLTKHAGTEGNPFTSKPTEYSQEPRDFDVDNTKQFITRAAKAERKVKIIDDEFNPEETEMATVTEKLDPVGKEDKDVNNDGKVNSTDGYLKKRRAAITSAMRAARQKEVQKKVDVQSKAQLKKAPQAGTLAAMKKEEVEIDEAVKTGNEGRGYHGEHESEVADKKYAQMHSRVRSLTGTTSPMAKHYLDSAHGRHLAGRENDSEYVKKDFLKFAKTYNKTQFEEVEQVDEISKKKLGNYIKAAADQKAVSLMTAATTKDVGNMEFHGKRYSKRNKGIMKAVDKLAKEEVEQIDEVDYEKYLKVSQEKRPVKIGAVMAARKAEKQGDENPIRKLANTQKAQRWARKQLDKKKPKKPYEPDPNPYGYGQGRYMGDSVEHTDDVLDEGKVAKALAVGAMSLASMGAKAHTDTTKSVAQLAKERPALAQRLKDIGAEGQVPASDKRASELQKKQDQEMPASERKAKELEKMKKEELEQMDELKKLTYASYIKKAALSRGIHGMETGAAIPNKEKMAEPLNKMKKRQIGIEKAANKLAKEEVEQVDEVSSKTLDAYRKKAFDKHPEEGHPKYEKRKAGRLLAFQKLTGTLGKPKVAAGKDVEEQVQQVDELKKSTVSSYLNKAAKKAKNQQGAQVRRLLKKAAKQNETDGKKLSTEQVQQVEEGRRGRPPKDPVARAKFYAAVADEPDQHIMMQVKKASDSEKPFHVTFKDGQKHPVEPGHAKKVLGKYMAMKPLEKRAFQKKIAKSHKSFMSEV